MTEEIDDLLDVFRKKVEIFFNNKDKVHVSFKLGYWRRGFIIQHSDDFFILDETFEGNIPVFYKEIRDICKFIENIKEKRKGEPTNGG